MQLRFFQRPADPRFAQRDTPPSVTVPVAFTAPEPIVQEPMTPTYPIPLAQAEARQAAAEQKITEHLARLAALETRLSETRQQGQAAAPGSDERWQAAQAVGGLEIEIKFEKADRPALDEELRQARIEVFISGTCVETARIEAERAAVLLADKQAIEVAQAALAAAQQKLQADRQWNADSTFRKERDRAFLSSLGLSDEEIKTRLWGIDLQLKGQK
jgi:hypothetical protein